MRAGDVALDDEAHVVSKRGVPALPTEHTLLRFLMRNVDLAFSRGQILNDQWTTGFNASGRSSTLSCRHCTTRSRQPAEADSHDRRLRIPTRGASS